ncbi:MAG TPA: hypothetical protein DEF45_01770 [Rhodopirellula sp.]|nr:hypothetical protein [Rhodopirellula sp.]
MARRSGSSRNSGWRRERSGSLHVWCNVWHELQSLIWLLVNSFGVTDQTKQQTAPQSELCGAVFFGVFATGLRFHLCRISFWQAMNATLQAQHSVDAEAGFPDATLPRAVLLPYRRSLHLVWDC